MHKTTLLTMSVIHLGKENGILGKEDIRRKKIIQFASVHRYSRTVRVYVQQIIFFRGSLRLFYILNWLYFVNFVILLNYLYTNMFSSYFKNMDWFSQDSIHSRNATKVTFHSLILHCNRIEKMLFKCLVVASYISPLPQKFSARRSEATFMISRIMEQ